MTQKLTLVFDGDVFRPEQPPALMPNTRVAAILSELPPGDSGRPVGEPLRVFHLGGEELPDEDLYATVNGTGE